MLNVSKTGENVENAADDITEVTTMFVGGLRKCELVFHVTPLTHSKY